MKDCIFELWRKIWSYGWQSQLYTTWAVVKLKPGKNSGLNGIQITHDLRDADTAMISQRSWVRIPFRPEFFQVLISQLTHVVSITAMINHKFIFNRETGTLAFLIFLNKIEGGTSREVTWQTDCRSLHSIIKWVTSRDLTTPDLMLHQIFKTVIERKCSTH